MSKKKQAGQLACFSLAWKRLENLHEHLLRHLNMSNVFCFQDCEHFLNCRILLVRCGLMKGNIKFKEHFRFQFQRSSDLGQILQRDIALSPLKRYRNNENHTARQADLGKVPSLSDNRGFWNLLNFEYLPQATPLFECRQ